MVRILDSRSLSRVRALFFLGTVGVTAVVAAALVLVGVLLALVKVLTHVGAVPLVFIGLGLFVGLSVLLAVGLARVRGWLVQRRAQATIERSSARPPPAPAPAPVAPTASSEPAAWQPIFDQAPPELADMSPASLRELFAGRTDSQAETILKQHVGKPVRVSGVVDGVDLGHSGEIPQVHLRSGAALLLLFSDDHDSELAFRALNVGDRIVVSAEIYRDREEPCFSD